MPLPMLLLASSAFWRAQSQPSMPFVSPMFSENMVLQRDRMDPMWGWSTPGDHVTIKIGDRTFKTTAASDGRWSAKVGPFSAGGPYTVAVQGARSATFNNILFGDVWICSGQSNMEFGISNGLDASAEIAAANYPNIRLFAVPRLISASPVPTTGGDWQVCTPTTIAADGIWGGFSAVAYFFGRKLNQDLNVPIGLIHTSWGGTPAEAWTDEVSLGKKFPEFRPQIQQVDASRNAPATDPFTPWYTRNDAGTSGNWQSPDLDVSVWDAIPVPGFFQQAGKPSLVNRQSVVWLRREVDLPEDAASKPLTLHFMADDNDATWVNGIKVGATDGYNFLRAYKIPAGVMKAGKNVIAVRVTDTQSPGGIYGDPAGLFLGVEGGTNIPLTGDWKVRLGSKMTAADPFPITLTDNPNLPSVLYNGMIEPIAPLAVKGAIWYQGESNSDRAYQYRTLLPAMIASWRSRFHSNFPFLVVQLAGFGAPSTGVGDDAWAELREAQYLTASRVPGVGIATAVDIGESGDIHPKNKQEVGRRLALVAEGQVYGQDLVYSGPAYRSMKVEGALIRVSFDHAQGLSQNMTTVDRSTPLRNFAVAGDDHKWYQAQAKIEGDTVVVSAPEVAHPVAVRYSWGAYTDSNLVNGAGLPAFPFRTDSWKGVTQK